MHYTYKPISRQDHRSIMIIYFNNIPFELSAPLENILTALNAPTQIRLG